ncbi:MAG: YbhN family protein [Candidatus Nanohaloarchaea archaeon]
MDTDKEKIFWFGATTAIILAMIWLADVEKFLEKLTAADPVYLIPAFLAGTAVLPIFGYIWYSFFKHMKMNVSYFKSLKMFLAGDFLNGITPLGQFGGEPLMAYIIQKNTDISYEKSLSTVISADIINALPVFTFTIGGAIYLILFQSINQLFLKTMYIALIIAIFGGALVYLMWFKAGKIENTLFKIFERITTLIGHGEHLLERIEKSLNKVQQAFQTIGESPKHLAKVAIVAHLTFILHIIGLYFVLKSLGVTTNLTPLYFVAVVSAFGEFSPTPGGEGTTEAIMSGALTLFVGVSMSTAVAAAIIYRLTTHWQNLTYGYISINTLRNGK